MKSINTEALIGKKILFASMPAEGHVNPLTGLAKYLQTQGCDVRWYTGSSYAPKMAKLGIPLFPFRKAVEVTGENLEEIFPERKKIKGQVKKLVFDMIHVFIRQAPKFGVIPNPMGGRSREVSVKRNNTYTYDRDLL